MVRQSGGLLECFVIDPVRIEFAFHDSQLAYSPILFFVLRAITFIGLMGMFTLVFISTTGVPYNIETQSMSAHDPWLCRNGVDPKYCIIKE